MQMSSDHSMLLTQRTNFKKEHKEKKYFHEKQKDDEC